MAIKWSVDRLISSAKRRLEEKTIIIPWSGCHIWMGTTNNSGYGLTNFGSEWPWTAHRLAWFVNFGEIPNGLMVCHICDIALCCNPSHLFLGTQGDNMADCSAKGRTLQGEKSPGAKLTENQVRKILLGNGSAKTLATELGVRVGHIYRIRRGERWAHLYTDGFRQKMEDGR